MSSPPLLAALLIGLSGTLSAQSPDGPRGVYPDPIADPIAVHSYVSALVTDAPSVETAVVLLTVGDRFLFSRRGSATRLTEFSGFGGISAGFDGESRAFHFLDGDFVVGLELAARAAAVTGRVRLYHQSSHLGDDFTRILERPDRNPGFDFEALRVEAALARGWVRVYGGGEWLFRHTPGGLGALRTLAGVDVEQSEGDDTRALRWLGGAHVAAWNERNWSPAFTVRAGVELGHDLRADGRRRIRILLEFHEGPTFRGQFYDEDATMIGVGIHFTR